MKVQIFQGRNECFSDWESTINTFPDEYLDFVFDVELPQGASDLLALLTAFFKICSSSLPVFLSC